MLDRDNQHLFLEDEETDGGSFIVNVNKIVNNLIPLQELNDKLTPDEVNNLLNLADNVNEVGGNLPIVATDSTEARKLSDRFADVINVKDFGAKGDGVTDDTAAFVSASSVQNDIFVPAGTYKISNIIDALFYGAGVLLIDGTYIPAGDISEPVTIPFPGPFDSFASIFRYLSRRNVSATVSIVIHEGIHDITEQITHNLNVVIFFASLAVVVKAAR